MKKSYRKRPNLLIEKEIDGEYVIVNTLNGHVHQLNPVAACIWRNLADDRDLNSLAAILCEEFDIDMDTAFFDTETCVRDLGTLGLLDEE